VPISETSTAQNQTKLQGVTFGTSIPNQGKCCTVSEPPSHACVASLFQWVQLVSSLCILFIASCM
jgi:riboflavin synthase alpha subunit